MAEVGKAMGQLGLLWRSPLSICTAKEQPASQHCPGLGTGPKDSTATHLESKGQSFGLPPDALSRR